MIFFNKQHHIRPFRKAGLLISLAICLLVFIYATKAPRSEPYTYSYPQYFGNRIYEPINNPATQAGVKLGRLLFYEKSLSANDQLSCGSCHQQERAFTDSMAFSLGVDGSPTKRNAMALVNLLWVKHYFWDGRASSLEDQAIVPLTDPHEMGQSLNRSAKKLQAKPPYPSLFKEAFGSDSITGERISQALAQFERTLISAKAPYDRYLKGEYTPNQEEEQGMALFFGRDNKQHTGLNSCGHCHGGPKLYSELFQNNGLDKKGTDIGRAALTGLPNDSGRFRVVTLRNIALTAPYMHDGRFKTLEEVLDHYSEHIQQSRQLSPPLRSNSGIGGYQFNPQEKKAILAFLGMLTDTAFIHHPAFSDPYSKKHDQ